MTDRTPVVVTRGAAFAPLVVLWGVVALALLHSGAPTWAWAVAVPVYLAACFGLRRLPRDDAVPAAVRTQSIRYGAAVIAVLAAAVAFAAAWPLALLAVLVGAFNLVLVTRVP